MNNIVVTLLAIVYTGFFIIVITTKKEEDIIRFGFCSIILFFLTITCFISSNYEIIISIYKNLNI